MRDRTLEKDEIREFGDLVQILRHPPHEYSWTQISNAAGYPAPGGARKAYDTRFKHVRVSNLITLRRYIEALKHTARKPGEQLGNPGSRRRPFMPPSDTVLVDHTLSEKKMHDHRPLVIENRPSNERPPELRPGSMVYGGPSGGVPLPPSVVDGMATESASERAVRATVANLRESGEQARAARRSPRRTNILNDQNRADFVELCDRLRRDHDYTWADIAMVAGYAGSWGVQQAYNNKGATSQSYFHRLLQHYRDLEAGKIESAAKRRAALSSKHRRTSGKALIGKQLATFKAILEWLGKSNFTYSDISFAAGYVGRRSPNEIPADSVRLALLLRFVEAQGVSVEDIVNWHRSQATVDIPIPANPQKRGSRTFDLDMLEAPAPPVKRYSPKTQTQVAVDIVKEADQKNAEARREEEQQRPSFAERMAAQEAAVAADVIKMTNPFDVIGAVKGKLESASTDLGNLLANQKLPPFMKEGLKRANDAIIQLIADHFEA